MFTLILAGSPREALLFAKDAGLTRPRVATSAEGIRGLRISNIVELPSFWARPDKHAVLAEVRSMLRRDRKATHVLYDEWIPPKERAGADQLPGQGTLDEALRQPPIVGEVIQTTGSSSRAQVLERPVAKPTSVSAIKAARKAGR